MTGGTCATCGLLVGNQERHAGWHRSQARAIKRAAQTVPCRKCKGSGKHPGLHNACGRCWGSGEER